MKKITSVLFILFAFLSFAQDAELRVQAGHGMVLSANELSISKDGRYLASAGGNTKLWDLATGREIRTFYGTNAVDISQDGKYIAAATDDSVKGIQKSFKVWELSTGKEVRSYGAHANVITDVKFSVDGAKLLSTSSDKTVKIWDFKTGENILTLSGYKTWVTCVAVSADGKFLATGSGEKTVKLWDLQTGKKIKVFKKQLQTIRDVEFSKDGKFILASSSGDGENPRVVVFNVESGTEELSFPGAAPACFSADGKTVFAQEHKDKSIIRIDIEGKKIVNRYLGHKDYLYAVKASADGSLIISSSQDKTIRVWDAASGRELKLLKGVTDAVQSVGYTADDKRFASLVGYDDLQLWETASVSYIKSYATRTPVHISEKKNFVLQGVPRKNQVNLIDVTENKIVKTFSDDDNAGTIDEIAMAPDGSFFVTGNADMKLKIWDIATGTKKAEIATTSAVTNLRISPDGNYAVASGKWNVVLVWDIAGKQLIRTYKGHAYDIQAIEVSPDSKFILSGSTDGIIRLWDLPANKEVYSQMVSTTDGVTDLAFSPDGKKAACSTFGNNIGILDPYTGKVLNSLKGHHASVFTVAYSHDGKHIISGSDDGEIKIWNAETFQEIVSIVFLSGSDGDYVAYTPDGYYMSTKGGTKAVHFIRENKVYFFDQFDLQYNRPDIVLERMGKAPQELIDSYRRAYEKRLKRLNFSPDKFDKNNKYQVPSIQLLNIQPYYSGIIAPDFHFNIAAEDKNYPLDRLNVWVNGVPVYGKEGKDLRALTTFKTTVTCDLMLSTGKNKVEVSVINEKGAESVKEEFEINHTPAVVVKPDLYLIALGVSKYKDSKMNLNYAAKDAQDFIKTFSAAKKDYQNIYIDTILDHAATLSNITDIRKKLMNTRVDDRVILFIAGHGLLDKNLDYYLATHDVDFINPAAKGLPYEKLEELLDGIPARNKILMMDACHSGEVDKEEMKLVADNSKEEGDITFRSFGNTSVKRVGLENSFELMKHLFSDLRKGNGTTVISSAGGAEYAMEGSQWQNGIFTYCLLSGLTDKKADLNKDGKVMLSELQKYLQSAVPEVTKGKQKPTSRAENLSNDWQVW